MGDLAAFGQAPLRGACFCLAGAILGSAFSVVKVGLEYSPPMIFAGMRTLIGGLVILLVAVVWGGSPHLRRDWPIFLLLAAFNVVFFFGFQTLAVLYLPSGTAAVLEYLQPMLVGLLAWMILGESLSLAKIVGMTVETGGNVSPLRGSYGLRLHVPMQPNSHEALPEARKAVMSLPRDLPDWGP